ncbi:acetyl-CoA acetyltransferase [Pseudofrankia sp. BMG5.36]|uniref:acetyl-CoA acetyltransferase n=1 Tax=Pseudofrankia sp. BMG5.36 TaxID=1834512 RepID=UPI0009F1CEF9|nr:acetyl-CoA acetyltransferase [Pseudofrankia sp. BMG5.36]
MTVPPATPVLVGAAAAARLPDAVELMAAATEAAAADAGAPGLLAAVDRVYVARGTWDCPDPGRQVADRFGAREARTVVAELGILQQSLITRACLDVTAGRAGVVLVLGAEAAHRGRVRLTPGRPTSRAHAASGRAGGEAGPPGRATVTRGPGEAGGAEGDAGAGGRPGSGPDEIIAPDADILAPLEIRRGLHLPVRQYAVLESALRAASGLGLAAHAAEVAALWAGFSRVAAGNEDAWARDPVTPAGLAPSERNPMMAWPYTRSHCSRAGVDQGAALLICSAAAARRFGVPPDRWVFPVTAAESNVMTPLAARPDLARSPGFRAVGERLAAVAGVAPADADYLDLYSCFPAAVRVQVRELGLTGRSDLTVTGGMTFAGGPLNNYVLQSTAAMARVLRAAEPGAHGLVTCVSGMVTKQAGLLWSASPPSTGFRAEDVSVDVRAAETTLPLVDEPPDGTGAGVVAGFTVACEQGAPVQALAVVTLGGATPARAEGDGAGGDGDEGGTGGDGAGHGHAIRTVAASADSDVIAAMTREEWVGRPVTVRAGTLLP